MNWPWQKPRLEVRYPDSDRAADVAAKDRAIDKAERKLKREEDKAADRRHELLDAISRQLEDAGEAIAAVARGALRKGHDDS